MVTYSIIIPVYNEQHIIETTLQRLSQLKDSEIIVIDGHPEKTTHKAITTKVKKITSQPGRAIQMNTGAKAAKGNILIFLHADTILPKDALQEIKQALKSAQACAFDFTFPTKNIFLKTIAYTASKRSRITRHPYGDQVQCFTKEYFNKIGQYKEIPLMEDVEIMQRIKKRKEKIYLIKDKVLTSPRRWQKEGMIYTTVRNWVLITAYYAGVSPKKLKKFYKKYLA